MKPETTETTVHRPVHDCVYGHGLEFTADGQYVCWGRDNKKHPRNWHKARKVYDTTIILLLDFFITGTSSAGAPAATRAKDDYGIGRELSIFCFVTVFLLGQVLGTIVFPPWSESFGRKKLYILSSGLSAIFCVVVGVVPSLAGTIVGRLFGGLLSAIPYTVGCGSVEDMFSSWARTWVLLFWTVSSNIGLSMGPIIGSHITEALSWRWLYYVYAIVLAILTVHFFFIRESRPSQILLTEVEAVRQETGDQSLEALNHDHSPDMQTFVRTALFRPTQLLFTEPLVIATALMSGFAFALLYLFTEALQLVYTALDFTPSQSTLPFLGLAVGFWFSIPTRLIDYRVFASMRRRNLPIKPESKLTGLAIGAPVFAIGLWWFAWTIPPMVPLPWIVPTISLLLVGFALNEFDTVLYVYLADAYLSYSASATAAVQFVRALLSGIFPLFTKQMFEGLGYNVAGSVVAALGTAFIAVPVLFIIYGERIRARSPFARYSLELEGEEKEG
ncbi:MFS multidrug transporter [Aspergillus steynii IBT 23096]|uniref:MFS multidrug transporter n=1 Tax=Aspergillus steynii IBT 23096 TaxID=1392250 RepID=A0A2I2GH44_9EURO|nr:MFS multidrug transporter [Aspergillus steynii IBT 23096]PLB52196.1 MFS multidrug transporter [Aspergillus steynii IBT 23096]